jgi:dUTP pyrophosphatase
MTVKVFFYSEKKDDKSLQDLQYATPGSAAVDIRCAADYEIKPYANQKIRTGLYLSLPDNYCMKVFPRSGLSAKTNLIFKNTVGIIDSDYRGRELFVMWYNLGTETITFKKGDRVAQVIVEKVEPIKYIEVDSVEALKQFGNDRGGGLGSTGIK